MAATQPTRRCLDRCYRTRYFQMVAFLVKSRPEHEHEADPMRTKKIVSKALLQNMLDQFVIWHRSLLQYIVRHKADPNIATALKLCGGRHDNDKKMKHNFELSMAPACRNKKTQENERGMKCLLQSNSSLKTLRRRKV